MQIYGFQKTTLLDYPKHLAATIFLGGCNMRCPFCHNASLVINPSKQPPISKEDVLTTLSKRKGILEGVCITGGEPTLYEELPTLIQEIKSLNLKVKLDSNGTNPTMLNHLIDEHLVDYIAMDIKNSKESYGRTIGISSYDTSLIDNSISLLLNCNIDYEFRTTIVKELHSEQDIHSLGQWLKGAKAYYLQSYKDSDDIISPGLHSHTKETLLYYQSILRNTIENVSIRGVD